METDARVVFCTVPDTGVGRDIARQLVEERLAACVNIVAGVTSVYRWQGEISTDAEQLLLIKTREELLGPLQSAIRRQHPYELPEIVAVPITGGLGDYLAWIAANTGT